MSLIDEVINLFGGLKSVNNTQKGLVNNDTTALPPISVVRSPDVQYGSTAARAGQPKIERDLVKVGTNSQPLSNAEYNKVSEIENLKDSVGDSDYISAYSKKYGVADNSVAEAIYNTAKKFGESPELMFKIANTESKEFDPKSYNAKTKAAGLFQFLPSTWKDVQTRLGGLAHGIKDPYDPAQNAAAAALYIQDIKKTLSKVKDGSKITDEDIYLGHFSGARRASQVIRAIESGKGNQLANTVYKPNEIKNNLPIFYNGHYKTVTNKAGKKVKQFVPTTMKTIKGVYDTITMHTNKEDIGDISLYLPNATTKET